MENFVSIEDIENAKDGILEYTFEDSIEGINSDGPVKADLTIKNLGEFVEVTGNVKGILNLECDLCLDEFKYDMDFRIDEIFAKNALLEDYGQEIEIKEGQFVTDLNGADKIDIYDLLYQSVILNIPNKKVCGINCSRDNFQKEEDLTDPRLEVFKNIRIKGEKG